MTHRQAVTAWLKYARANYARALESFPNSNARGVGKWAETGRLYNRHAISAIDDMLAKIKSMKANVLSVYLDRFNKRG